jgi:predicted CXXCH cytochrome family protein
MEWLLVTALVAAAVVVLLAGRARLLAALLAGGAAAGFAFWTPPVVSEAMPRRDSGGYVTSDACRACHPAEYASWHKSFHRTMTQPASAAATRAPFAGETLVDGERRYHLRRQGDELWADISGVGARKLALMTGSHHMQAFWLSGDAGNLKTEFPFTYLFDDRRWVSRRDVFLVGSEYSKDPAHWNRICIECHVTGGQPGFDGEAPNSRVAELGIACEACHGPAAEHLAQNRDPWRRRRLAGQADPTIVNPARLSPERGAEVCGQCHGISCPPEGWLKSGIHYRPGQVLHDDKQVLQPGHLGDTSCGPFIDDAFASSRYWKDGMVRVSGREYNALLASPCRGLSCWSCHSMHQSDPNRQLIDFGGDGDVEGNRACRSCHRDLDEKHSHHAAGSTGAACYNCHMPHTTYGLLRAMRSHQISVPSVKETLQTGRPNACNLCHADCTLGWTAATLERWYGTPQPPLDQEQRTVAQSILEVARGEAGVRAVVAWNLGWTRAAWSAPLLIELLDDEYPAVRYVAARSLRALPGFSQLRYDYVGSQESRWAAQTEARRRLTAPHQPPAELRPVYERGELERLLAGRPEDDQMFLAE